MNVYSSNSKVDRTEISAIARPSSSSKRGSTNNVVDDNNSFDTIHTNSEWSCPDTMSEFVEFKRVRTEKNQVIATRLCPTTLRKLVMDVDDVPAMKCWGECTHLFFSCLGFGIDEEFQIGWLPDTYWVHGADVLSDARTYMALIQKIKLANPSLQIVYSMPPMKTFGICVEDIFRNNRVGFWNSLIKCAEGADGIELNLELCSKLPLTFWKSYEDYSKTLPTMFIVLPNSPSYLRTLPYTVVQIADTNPDLFICINSFGFKKGLSSSCEDLDTSLGILWGRGFFPQDIVVGIDSCGIKVVKEGNNKRSEEMLSNRDIRRLYLVDDMEISIDKTKGASVLFAQDCGDVHIYYDSEEIQEMKLKMIKACQGVICGDYYQDPQLLFKAVEILKLK